MALGFNVYVLGVHRLGVHRMDYREPWIIAWRSDPPWFDCWALARDTRIRHHDADQLMGVFTADEVKELHAEFVKRVRKDGTVDPSETDSKIYSDDPLPCTRRSRYTPTVEEFECLLNYGRLKWVIIHLWDIS
jgi:hypothetical protein